MVRVFGEASIRKSGVGGRAITSSAILALRSDERALVAVTVIVYWPGMASMATSTGRVEVTEPCGGRVSLYGSNDSVTPEGADVVFISVISWLNPFFEVRVIVEVSNAPCKMARSDGSALISKSGGGGGGTIPLIKSMISSMSLIRSSGFSTQAITDLLTSFWSLFKAPVNAPASIWWITATTLFSKDGCSCFRLSRSCPNLDLMSSVFWFFTGKTGATSTFRVRKVSSINTCRVCLLIF